LKISMALKIDSFNNVWQIHSVAYQFDFGLQVKWFMYYCWKNVHKLYLHNRTTYIILRSWHFVLKCNYYFFVEIKSKIKRMTKYTDYGFLISPHKNAIKNEYTWFVCTRFILYTMGSWYIQYYWRRICLYGSRCTSRLIFDV